MVQERTRQLLEELKPKGVVGRYYVDLPKLAKWQVIVIQGQIEKRLIDIDCYLEALEDSEKHLSSSVWVHSKNVKEMRKLIAQMLSMVDNLRVDKIEPELIAEYPVCKDRSNVQHGIREHFKPGDLVRIYRIRE